MSTGECICMKSLTPRSEIASSPRCAARSARPGRVSRDICRGKLGDRGLCVPGGTRIPYPLVEYFPKKRPKSDNSNTLTVFRCQLGNNP